jgi:SAM-dependent methyltransferase
LTRTPVLWKSLIDAWELSDEEAAYVDLQQGCRCAACGTSLRGMALALAIMRAFSHDGTFSSFVESERARNLRVLEINEADALSSFLRRLPGHVLVRYPDVDATALPFADRAFDLVCHSDSLEHIAEPVAALRECRRVLSSSGLVAYTVPIIVGRMTRRRTGLAPSYHAGPAEESPDYLVQSEYGADAWRELIQAGFSECRIVSIGHPAAHALVGVR